MKTKNMLMRAGAALMAAAMVATTGASAAMAASSTDPDNNLATRNDLANADIIDTSKKGSLTIYKYDITSATKDGVYNEGDHKATGEADTSLQELMKDYAVEGVEFTYLRLGNVETYSTNDGTTNKVELVYEVPDKLKEILKLQDQDKIDMTAANVSTPCQNTGVSHYTSEKLNDALKNLLSSNNIEGKNALEDYVESSDQKVRMTLTDKKGMTTATNLELGLYLLIESKVPEEVVDTVNPWFVQLPFTNTDPAYDNPDGVGTKWLYDMTCYPKNQTGNPDLDKLVRNAHGNAATKPGEYEDNSKLVSDLISDKEGGVSGDQFVSEREEYTYGSTTTASEGDVLDYILVSKLPHITSKATYLTKYTFVDTLSEGLTYNKDAKLAFYKNGDDAKVNNTKNATEIWGFDNQDRYNQGYADLSTDFNKKTGEEQMTVSFTEAGLELLNTKYSDYYIVVYYTVTVNSDATTVLGDDGNPNDVTLEWRRTSEQYYNTLEDRCYVYTFGLNLTKDFNDGQGDPTKVQFILFNTTDGYYVKAEKTQVVDGKKVYYVTGKTTKEEEATIFSPDAGGYLIVSGLEGDKYQLTEIQTDDGYSLLKDQIVIEIDTTTREIKPSVAGYVGQKSPKDGHKHTPDCYDENGDLVCGKPSLDDPNGRTIGKTAMFEGEVDPASAQVDGVDANMSDYVVNGSTTYDGQDNSTVQQVLSALTDDEGINSDDAQVDVGITNSKGFLLPITGGYGMYALTICGVLAVAAGCYIVVRKRKK